ncbi:MAG: hypothetical protein IPI73_26465 [Betaproteobacteria bacterium]|nr:hypothetical protein [Betaproteobacteria bacterium]
MRYGSAGVGSPTTCSVKCSTKRRASVCLHVPYTAIAQAVGAVIGETTSMAYENLPTVQGFVKAGKLEALAVTSQQRVAGLPNLQAIARLFPGY